MMGRADLYRLAFAVHGRLGRRCFPNGRALPPLQLFLEVTARCDQRCSFCFYRGVLARPEDSGSAELAGHQLLDIVQQLPSARLVSISGGEPLLRDDLLDILSGIGRDRLASLETNGATLDRFVAAALVRLGSRNLAGPGLVGVDVSLHGHSRTHDRLVGRKGALERTVNGIAALIDARRGSGRRFPLVTIKCVITRDNLAELAGVRALATELGVDHLALKLLDPGRTAMELLPPADPTDVRSSSRTSPLRSVEPLAWSRDELVALRAALDEILDGSRRGPEVFFIPLGAGVDDALRHYGGRAELAGADCLNAWSRLSVLPNGDYYLCKAFGAGNLAALTPAEAWNSSPFTAFRRRLIRGLPPECVGCCYLEHPPT